MEYASLCWAPTSKKLATTLESVHHNAAKFASNIYPRKGEYEKFSITKILNDLNWSSLETRRKQARLSMAYKRLNDQVILESDLLPRSQSKQPMRQCNEIKNQLFEPPSRLDVIGDTFFYATPKLWNSNVTIEQANAPSIDTFRRYFKK